MDEQIFLSHKVDQIHESETKKRLMKNFFSKCWKISVN